MIFQHRHDGNEVQSWTQSNEQAHNPRRASRSSLMIPKCLLSVREQYRVNHRWLVRSYLTSIHHEERDFEHNQIRINAKSLAVDFKTGTGFFWSIFFWRFGSLLQRHSSYGVICTRPNARLNLRKFQIISWIKGWERNILPSFFYPTAGLSTNKYLQTIRGDWARTH